jgi:uncharacterized protein
LSEDAVERLHREVDEYAEEIFHDFTPNRQSPARAEGKIIRDPIHGFHHLDPWEVEVVDSPLLQRLRYIRQNGLAYLVYPTANHTRLDHSLGVAKVVGDVASAFAERRSEGRLFSATDVAELRMAALLHDVGHGIFSHLSEAIIELYWYEELSRVKRVAPYEGKAAGEILSYMLVTSKTFREFFNEVVVRHNHDLDLDRVAGYILGTTTAPLMHAYKPDVITGPLDADKLDYLARDSYFTGIKSEADIPNIIRSLRVWGKRSGIGRSLVVRLSGANFVEQMHFARLLLFPAMYHHQKVRALECMVRGIIEVIRRTGARIKDRALRFERMTDFLRLTDDQFLTLAGRERELRDKISRLLNRTLLRRAVHISTSVIVSPLEQTRYSDLVKLDMGKPRDYGEILSIREEIFNNLPSALPQEVLGGRAVDVSDLWLDIPRTPAVSRDVMRCYVDSGEAQPLELRKLFPIDAWLQSYAENKWTGHVFGYPNDEYLHALNKAAVEVLEQRFQLRFSPRATLECKLGGQ